MKYYMRIDEMPESPTYEQPQSLHRMGMDDEGELVLEKWDAAKKEWVDNPGLLAVTGIGGEHDYLPIEPEEAEEILKSLKGEEEEQKARLRIGLGEKEGRFVTVDDQPVFIGGPGQGGGGASAGGESARLAKLKEVEGKIVDQPVEHGAIVSDDGEVKKWFVGEKDRIEIPKEAAPLMKDATFTHNHPTTGASLSPDDVWVGIQSDMREMRAVGRSSLSGKVFVHSMKRPEGGWPTDDTFQIMMNHCNHLVRKDFFSKIENKEMSIEEAEFLHWHAVWTVFSARTGWEYTREEL